MRGHLKDAAPKEHGLVDNLGVDLEVVGLQREALNKPLYRGYLLKEMLRLVFATKGEEGVTLLRKWLVWAQRCRIPAFVNLAAQIRRHREGIEATLIHGVSNGRVEATNNQIRLLTRLAHGFHSAAALIALAFLKLGGLATDLPRRPSLG